MEVSYNYMHTHTHVCDHFQCENSINAKYFQRMESISSKGQELYQRFYSFQYHQQLAQQQQQQYQLKNTMHQEYCCTACLKTTDSTQYTAEISQHITIYTRQTDTCVCIVVLKSAQY